MKQLFIIAALIATGMSAKAADVMIPVDGYPVVKPIKTVIFDGDRIELLSDFGGYIQSCVITEKVAKAANINFAQLQHLLEFEPSTKISCFKADFTVTAERIRITMDPVVRLARSTKAIIEARARNTEYMLLQKENAKSGLESKR